MLILAGLEISYCMLFNNKKKKKKLLPVITSPNGMIVLSLDVKRGGSITLSNFRSIKQLLSNI